MILKPLNRFRKSSSGNWGPGTDSIPEDPDRNPALATKKHQKTKPRVQQTILVIKT